MAKHERPTVLVSDGRFAAGIVMSNGHTVRGEYKHLTYEAAETDAKEWFEKETAEPAKPPRKNGSKKESAVPAEAKAE